MLLEHRQKKTRVEQDLDGGPGLHRIVPNHMMLLIGLKILVVQFHRPRIPIGP
jgi:hypothetical protein